ncbi:MAG: hypothetical protein M3P95_11410 [Actinomycetota bacterium]|jgi:hypothetical protein|nr:hypothetical protein [Actinomycetota bacterium]
MIEQPQTPDVSHNGTGLTEEQAQQVASLGTVRDTESSGPEYLAMDADNQVGRGADGDSAARAERKEETT